ncbi:hypothetical protein DPMN_135489 [Dreissena polymorpha]|uniref:Uncharacterized protein n=1 Tax=Dreissena polymorpha TaxID=45954 RepID=A0A9D4JBQ9_DREPO|nr:hypothetical protein DPMN_135489 [Dreissena polymorpha]
MRDEFLHAAELYLECNKPAKAALCLQNAKERGLAAELFEKLGQVWFISIKEATEVKLFKCYAPTGSFPINNLRTD